MNLKVVDQQFPSFSHKELAPRKEWGTNRYLTRTSRTDPNLCVCFVFFGMLCLDGFERKPEGSQTVCRFVGLPCGDTLSWLTLSVESGTTGRCLELTEAEAPGRSL